MIPNVFVSSTITDLQYLREAVRDALTEVFCNPVMSEQGGVGYIHDGSAADACYWTVKQCHLAILIIGKKYGEPGKDGLSVTHKEFRAAREHHVPLITFIDAEVMHFKKVYDALPDRSAWDGCKLMDHPHDTFRLVEEVRASEIYNGLLEFGSANEVKGLLKKQLAHFMGDRLTGAVRPIKNDVQEILAEVKTLRNQLEQGHGAQPKATRIGADPFYVALRFLLEERNKEYAKFVEYLFGDMDVAAREIQGATTIEDLVKKAGVELEVVPEKVDVRRLWKDGLGTNRLRYASDSEFGSLAVTNDKHVYLSELTRQNLNERQAALKAKLR